LRRNFLKVSDYGYYGWPNNFSVIPTLTFRRCLLRQRFSAVLRCF
jgi:hypothetical protein